MKIKFEGPCPHCKKKIELLRDLPQEVISQMLERVKSESNGNLPEEAGGIPEQKYSVDPEWLKETLQLIRWKESTALSWIKAQLKVSGQDLMGVLNSLDKEQLKIFVDHIGSMRAASGQ